MGQWPRAGEEISKRVKAHKQNRRKIQGRNRELILQHAFFLLPLRKEPYIGKASQWASRGAAARVQGGYLVCTPRAAGDTKFRRGRPQVVPAARPPAETLLPKSEAAHFGR